MSDRTVRMVSLDPTDCLAPLSMQALPAAAESLAIIEMGGEDAQSTLFLNIGLEVSINLYFACLKRYKSSILFL